MDRSGMKNLISRLISYIGVTSASEVLDQLKTIGFNYATKFGISLGIDDLLTTPFKGWFMQDAEKHASISEKHNRYGTIHAVEKLRQLIETWYTTSEYLKQEMSPNFKITDPYNPVHMMSFSGARGNASQVHQLVGMRGLMADPQGQIIDLPIQSNFREGLSLTEYIISCYGARKGVVDTAVRTADAGYLTRRLVEVVQHIVVRKIDCGSIDGIQLKPLKEKKIKNLFGSADRLVGRVLATDLFIDKRCIAKRNQDIGSELAINIINYQKKAILIRSPLTCKSKQWLCQYCYGWSPCYGDMVELGEAVGIIAGQSIGEPGTQLTLRTFHTGGVFTGDIAEHVRAPFNGIAFFSETNLQATRSRHGHPAWISKEDIKITIQYEEIEHKLNIPANSLILIKTNQYVKSKQVLAEVRAKIAPLKEQIEKYIYSDLSGEIHWGFPVRHTSEYIYSNLHTVQNTGHIWVVSGNIKNSNKNLLLFYKKGDYILKDFLNKKLNINFQVYNKKLNFYQKSIRNSKKNINNLINSTEFLNINSSAIFATYRYKNTKMNENNPNIFSETNLNKYSLKKFYNFVLEKNQKFISNNTKIASSSIYKHHIENCGIIKYGSIQIKPFPSNFDQDLNPIKEKIKPLKLKYELINSGTIFWIPEYVHTLVCSRSSILVQDGMFIEAGTEIFRGFFMPESGLVQIKSKTNKIHEITIVPGKLLDSIDIFDNLKKQKFFFYPGEEIIPGIKAEVLTYLYLFGVNKQKNKLLLRPAKEFFIEKLRKNPINLIPIFGTKKDIKIALFEFIVYEDGQQVRSKEKIELVQTCLITNIKKGPYSENAKFFSIDVFFKNLRNRFLNFCFSNQTNFEKMLSKRNFHKNLYFCFKTLNNKKKENLANKKNKDSLIQNKGYLQLLETKNTINKNLLFVSRKNQIQILYNKITKEDLKENYKDINTISKIKKTKIYHTDQQVFTIQSFYLLNKNLGFLGNFYKNKLLFQFIFDYNKIKTYKKDLSLDINTNLLKNKNWFLIDESNNFFQLKTRKNQNVKQKKIEKDIRINLGNFFSQNVVLFNTRQLPESGQILYIEKKICVFRLCRPYLATKNAIIYGNYKQIITSGDNFITIVYERFKTRDIIQGLPKVEQLLEARPLNNLSSNLDFGFLDWNTDISRLLGNPWGFFLSSLIIIRQSQLELVNQIQKVYQSQGVQISDKHLEIIVRQMTSRVLTTEENGPNAFLPGELVDLFKAQRMNQILENSLAYKPILLGITRASLNTYSFISEASFQETTKVLTKAALQGRIDWLQGLKENVILGGIIPAGTGYQKILNKKNSNFLENKKEVSIFVQKQKNIKFNILPSNTEVNKKESIQNLLKKLHITYTFQ